MAQDQNKKKITVTGRFFDYGLLFIIIVLLGLGLVMIYSVSSYEAQQSLGDASYYLRSQGIAVVIGVILMILVSFIPQNFWKSLALPIYFIALILNALVFVPGIGSDLNTGSRRWISIANHSFQPSEIVKLAVILLLAVMLSKLPKQIRNFRSFVSIIIVLLPVMIIVAMSNLSTAIIIAGIAFIMLYVINAQKKHLLGLVILGVAAIALFIAFFQYRNGRLSAWLHPEDNSETFYQTQQGLYAIGSGGLFGRGLGESIQKINHVPEAQNDFIFSIIVEELGLFGAICIILLFVLMIWRLMVIAVNARDLYGSLVAVGVMAHIGLQVILNIAVVTNTIPNTGITLPFISYGGTSVIITLIEMGIVLNISRSIPMQIGARTRQKVTR